MKLFRTGAWARLLNSAVGIWLMAAPAVLGYDAPAATSDRLIGPVAVSFAIIALWEVTRPVRRVNTALGLWLLAAPWLLGYAPVPAVNSIIAGVLLITLSLVRGEVSGQYGGGWRAVWKGYA